MLWAIRWMLAALPLMVSVAMAQPFELRPKQRIGLSGQAVESGQPGVQFDIIPTRPLSSKTWNNPVTGGVEQRIWPAILHPIPVLHASHVASLKTKPDPKTLALDFLRTYGGEAEIKADEPYMLLLDDNASEVRLITLNKIEIPQDATDRWIIGGSIEPLTVVEHIADSVADRGRAVISKEPLALGGHLIFGERPDANGPMKLTSLQLPSGEKQALASGTETKVSQNGVVVDRVEMGRLVVTDATGKQIGEIKLPEFSEANEFVISPEGRRIALSTERMVERPNDAPSREIVTIVYSASGRKMGEFVGYDDPGFFPDGRLILTGTGTSDALFIGDLKTGAVTQLAIKDSLNGEQPEWVQSPVVSPDGKWIAYRSRRDLFVVGVDGTGWTPIWIDDAQQPQYSPVFSPDGKYVAMIVVPLDVMTGPGQIHVVDLNRRVRQVIEASQGADSHTPLVWAK